MPAASGTTSTKAPRARPVRREGASVTPAAAEPASSWPNVFRIGINATPWASIEVDGIPVGQTPIAGLPLLSGYHDFEARFPDGRVVRRQVEVGPETRSIVFP